MADYASFLTSKRREWTGVGVSVAADDLPPVLFPFQRALVRWALRKGRAAIFSTTGTGKTVMQIAWAEQIQGRTLIVAPLCVETQTIAEAKSKLGVEVVPANSGGRIEIVNYERLHQIAPSRYDAVVLDESSRIKADDAKTRARVIAMFRDTPYRLCCSATPAPNDTAELANHCEFLGIMTRPEMLATFFVHDETGWRLKGHAHEAFYRWLASWAMFLRRPSDLGFSDDGYLLPPLEIRDVVVAGGGPVGEFMFPGMGLGGISGRSIARRRSLKARVDAAVQLIEASPGPWIAWCGLNDEQEAIATALGDDCVSVAGSDAESEKVARLRAFLNGRARVLVSKVLIAGFGLNMQHCSQMVFVGINDSWEQYFQAIRRCWRFGQASPVTAHIVVSDAETEIVSNVRRKEQDAERVAEELVRAVRDMEREEVGVTTRQREHYQAHQEMILPPWLKGVGV